MRAVALERRTRQLVQRWTATAVLAALGVVTVTLAAGGATAWTRLLLGGTTVFGIVAATRFRTGLHLAALGGAAMIAIVPQDAVLDRGVVAALGAVLLLVACESAHVARQLITVAPVQSTALHAAALSRLTVAAGIGVAVTSSFAQFDRWGGRPLVIGLAIAGTAVVALVGRQSPDGV